MITRGFGENSYLITRGMGLRHKIIKQVIRLFSKFYTTLFVRSDLHKVENIMLKSHFSNNIYLKSNFIQVK
ncbi:MAG: hypothetical protein BWY47_00594 [Bacteroidetes bacterium ADurb.Bin302]|nr:MAG: hypothetical protein BWY47_00594 [Bacteroidetes bacterium ADurb.Bin302]